MKSCLTIHTNPRLSWACAALLLLTTASCGAVIVLLGIGVIEAEPPEDRALIQWIFAVLGGGMVAAVLCSMSRWFATVKFYTDHIEYKRAFKKRLRRKYSEYPHVYKAVYQHGSVIGAGNEIFFIVFSQNRLSTWELTHIDQVPNGDAVIKIRCGKGVFARILSVCPPRLRCELKRLVPDERLV